MAFQSNDVHLIKIGDRIINLDRVDHVVYEAEEKTETRSRPTVLKVYFDSSEEPLLLKDIEASGLFSFLTYLAEQLETNP